VEGGFVPLPVEEMAMAKLSQTLNSARFRGAFYQMLVIGGTVALAGYLVSNTLHNLSARGIATGFGFLTREAGFDIGESLVAYSAADSYGRAIVVGLFNTLAVSVAGIALASFLGLVFGVARLSSNWAVSRVASLYVEVVRNVPLLLQLFVWYGAVMALPGPRQAIELAPHTFLSNRGLKIPLPAEDPLHLAMLAAVAIGGVMAWQVSRWARRRQEATGRPFPTLSAGLGLLVVPALLVWLVGGMPTAMDLPHMAGFNFVGGGTLSPEFTALLLGLSVYTGGFIAEIVRSGIQVVPPGQTEAAIALGLPPAKTLRLVILPQALRVIIPPLTSQFLNLTKNTSLALAIGFPDLVSVTNTAANQTGQVVESVALMMAVFLAISLGISVFMNWYNKKVALVTR
jgi:general L-amino acid transport system permease protein